MKVQKLQGNKHYSFTASPKSIFIKMDLPKIETKEFSDAEKWISDNTRGLDALNNFKFGLIWAKKMESFIKKGNMLDYETINKLESVSIKKAKADKLTNGKYINIVKGLINNWKHGEILKKYIGEKYPNSNPFV